MRKEAPDTCQTRETYGFLAVVPFDDIFASASLKSGGSGADMSFSHQLNKFEKITPIWESTLLSGVYEEDLRFVETLPALQTLDLFCQKLFLEFFPYIFKFVFEQPICGSWIIDNISFVGSLRRDAKLRINIIRLF